MRRAEQAKDWDQGYDDNCKGILDGPKFLGPDMMKRYPHGYE